MIGNAVRDERAEAEGKNKVATDFVVVQRSSARHGRRKTSLKRQYMAYVVQERCNL